MFEHVRKLLPGIGFDRVCAMSKGHTFSTSSVRPCKKLSFSRPYNKPESEEKSDLMSNKKQLQYVQGNM